MTQCRRCGLDYRSAVPTAPPHVLPAQGSRETPSAAQAASPRRTSAVPLVLLLVLGLGVCALGLVVRVARRAVLRHAVVDARRMSGGSGIASAPADAAAPSNPSLFVESASQQEMPVLTFRNFAPGTMTLTLRDRYGHVYRASSSQEQESSLQVPAGDYSISVDSDDPHIRPNWGDATFRKFKAYSADFVMRHTERRVHLGD
jgi:hypothetical protein